MVLRKYREPRFGEHLQSLPESERSAWQQAIHFLCLLVFFRRSVAERAVLERIVSETRPHLGLSDEEEQLMQSMADHYFEQGREQGREQGIEQGREQGIEQGARQNSIENTIAILNARFPNADAHALKPTLEAIDDLSRLNALNLSASLANSFRQFQQQLEG